MKKTIVFVPLSAVPHFVPIRFKNRWWKKRISTLNQLFDMENSNNKLVVEKHDRTYVAIFKKDLRGQHYYLIKEEIKP